MAVTEVIGLTSVFNDPPHFQLFKHHAEVVEDTLRLSTLLMAMVGFTDYITAQEKIICSPKENNIEISQHSRIGDSLGIGNSPWLRIVGEICEDELTTIGERWMPYIIVVESLALIFLHKSLFRDLRTQNAYMRLYDFVSTILAPKQNETGQQDGIHGCLLDQRQLVYNYGYFLDEIKNSFRKKRKCIRDSSMMLTIIVGFIALNAIALHMFDTLSSEVMMCQLNDKSFPPNFFPANYSVEFVCFLTTKENNYLLGWCFIGTLVLQMVYVGWRLGRDIFGKSRIHRLMLKFGSQYSLPQDSIEKSDLYFIMRLLECNVTLPSELIVVSHMNKCFLDLWQCDINTRNIVITSDSVSFKIEDPIIENYITNDETPITNDMKIYVWILKITNAPQKSSIKVVSPGDEVTFEKLEFGECKIEGCVSYRNRLLCDLLTDDFVFETTPDPPMVNIDRKDVEKLGTESVLVGELRRTKKMKEGRTHDIIECKIEYSNLKTHAIKTEIFDVSQDAPQRISPNDNFIELLIQNLTPGNVYIINGIYVKTKYSNWSDSMQMDKKQQVMFTQPTAPSHIRFSKQESEDDEDDVRYNMTWKNSACSENHHYVIQGKFSMTRNFTSHIYPKNPERCITSLDQKDSTVTTEAEESELSSDYHKTNVHVIYTNETETSVLLPPNCTFLNQFWCQVDSFEFQGLQCEGQKSTKVSIGGGLQNWIDAGRNNLGQ